MSEQHPSLRLLTIPDLNSIPGLYQASWNLHLYILYGEFIPNETGIGGTHATVGILYPTKKKDVYVF